MIIDSGFWQSFPTDSCLSGVLVSWQHSMGKDFARGREFLKPTTGRSDYYPCQEDPPCGCLHRVFENSDGLVAACTCAYEDEDYFGCPPLRVELPDLMIYALDLQKLGDALRRALNLAEISAPPVGDARPIGRHPHGSWPVYLWVPPCDGAMLKVINQFTTSLAGPALFLVPWDEIVSPEMKAILTRQGLLTLGLEQLLAPGDAGALIPRAAMAAKLAEIEKGLANHRGLDVMVREIKQDIAVVASGTSALLRENQELKQLQSDGLFKFALRVDSEDFRAFAVIMALGNRKAAADFLAVPHRTFYDRVDRWAGLAGEYQKMARAVEWRKNVGRKIIVRLGDALQSGEPGETPENPDTVQATLDRIRENDVDSRDYPGLLADILETLRHQNARNWPAVQTELISIIKEELPQ